MKRRAFTLVEVLIAGSLFCIISALLLAVFLSGSKAMILGTVQANVVQQTNVACFRFSREVERSIYEASSCNASACSILSAVGPNGLFTYDAGTNIPRWQDYLIFFHDATRKQLRLARRSVVGTPTETAPITIEQFGGVPLSNYANGGTVIAENIYACEFQLLAQRQARLAVGAEGVRPGRPMERYSQQLLVNFRN